MSISVKFTKAPAATLSFAFQNPDGTDRDLAGCRVTLVVRRSAAYDPVLDRTGGTSANVASFALTDTDTDIDIRAWQAKLTLLDGQGVESYSRIFYLYVTAVQVGDSTTNIIVGDDDVDVTVDVQQPDNAVDKYFRQDFTLSNTVTVSHNLQKRPSVTVVDSAGDEVEVTVVHVDDNNLTLSIANVFSGN